MASNRDKLREEYEDALFKMLMHEVAEHEGKALMEEMQSSEESSDLQPSDLALKRFSKQLDIELGKQRRAEHKRIAFIAFRTMAISLVAVVAVFFTAMTAVSAFRIRVMNIWMDIRPEYTAFQLRGSDSTEAGSMIVNWSNAYVPTYIPEGYEVSSFSYNEGFKRIVFENTPAQTFILYTELDEASNLAVDTENADRFEEISIHDHIGTLVLKNNMVTIVWEQGGRMFMIQAQADVGTVIRMAEGVKFLK